MNNAIHIYLDYVLCIIGNWYYANLIKGLLSKGKEEICIYDRIYEKIAWSDFFLLSL